ncbi:MAG: hypothetical protein D6730_11410 [Bacteroidetes bacterium]|nr:MAG: hypothetical protein D6730_11410 [Bacteroidota bacterium]
MNMNSNKGQINPGFLSLFFSEYKKKRSHTGSATYLSVQLKQKSPENTLISVLLMHKGTKGLLSYQYEKTKSMFYFMGTISVFYLSFQVTNRLQPFHCQLVLELEKKFSSLPPPLVH